MEAVRRLESTALGSDGLQRLTGLAVRLLAADGAAVSSWVTWRRWWAARALPTGSLGRQVLLADSLGAVALANGGGPLVVPDARRDPGWPTVPRSPTAGSAPTWAYPWSCPTAPRSARSRPSYTRASREWTASDVALLRQLADAATTELELAATAKEFEAHRLRFELAIDAAKIGSFDWDLVSGRLVWDDRLVEIFGTCGTFDETIRPSPTDAIPTTSSGRWRRCRRPSTPAGSTSRSSGSCCRRVRPAGSRAAAAPWPVTAGRPSGWSVPATTRRASATGTPVARVLEAMSAAFFSLDRAWRFTYVNAEAERLLARTRTSCWAVRSGSSSRARWAAPSRSTTGVPPQRAWSGCSRRTTRLR